MIDPSVREATAADAPALQWLESIARKALTDARGGGRWLEQHPRIGHAWTVTVTSDAASITWVAELDAVVVGYLRLITDDDGTARVDQVFVHPGARECGFGDALLEAALHAARERGSVRIEGEALPGDRDTKNLYERARITARLIIVSAPL